MKEFIYQKAGGGEITLKFDAETCLGRDGRNAVARITPGGVELVGFRRIYWRPSKQGDIAWVTVAGAQVKAKKLEIETLKGTVTIAAVDFVETVYNFPFPLETKEDARYVFKIGFNGSLSPNKWRVRLGWKGIQSVKAAEDVWRRWQSLTNGGGPLDCPGVTFPASSPPPAHDGMGEGEKRIQELEMEMEGVKAKLASIESRLAILEFIP